MMTLLQVWLPDLASTRGRQAHSDVLIKLINRLSDVSLPASILTQPFFILMGRLFLRAKVIKLGLIRLCGSEVITSPFPLEFVSIITVAEASELLCIKISSLIR